MRTLEGAAAILEGLGHDSAGCTGRAGRVLRSPGTQPSLPREHEVALGLDLEVVANKKAKMARGVKIVKTDIYHRTLPGRKREKLVEKVSDRIEVPVTASHVLETQDWAGRVSDEREDPSPRDLERERERVE